MVFSNGLMPEAVVHCLEGIPPERVSVLVNIHSPHEQNPHETERQAATLHRLGRRVILGFNIHTATPDLDFLLPRIEQDHLSRSIRLGLAHPCVDGSNRFLRPKEYAAVGRRVAELVRKAEEQKVTMGLDCGFVPCMFPDGFVESPGLDPPPMGLRCGPMPDILPDGSVASCYPLASVWLLSLSDERDAASLQAQFKKQMQPYRTLGVFRRCALCGWREAGRCLGGCLLAAMQRLRLNPFTLTVTEDATVPPSPKGGRQR